MTKNNCEPQRLIDWPAVKERIPLSRSTIYRKIRSGTFPAPVTISSCRIAWVEGEVDEWVAAQIEAGPR